MTILVTKGLRKQFGGVVAVEGADLELRHGVVTGLIGPNGAGKTTIFNLITNNIAPDAGSVMLNGREIVGMRPHHIARAGIARSYQDLSLFTHMTVLDNVLTVQEISPWLWQPGGRAARVARRNRAHEILEVVGLSASAHARAIDLAYAERKFLSLARIIAADKPVWLLDEPASGLDSSSLARFKDILRDAVAKGVAVCLIEHNLDLVTSLADRIVFLDRGRVLADDAPSAILQNKELSTIYFGTRAEPI